MGPPEFLFSGLEDNATYTYLHIHHELTPYFILHEKIIFCSLIYEVILRGNKIITQLGSLLDLHSCTKDDFGRSSSLSEEFAVGGSSIWLNFFKSM